MSAQPPPLHGKCHPEDCSGQWLSRVLFVVGVSLCAAGVLTLWLDHARSPTLFFRLGVQRAAPMAVFHRPSAAPSHRSPSAALRGLSDKAEAEGQYPVFADESVMAPKAHGSTDRPVQLNLRWGVEREVADKICSFNRRYAEYAGYFQREIFTDEARAKGKLTFYDSVTGKPLFVAPRGRTMEEFLAESRAHGWPSFRDEEVVWENTRVISEGGARGECVSVDGTHLGHNLPDSKGNRYCINLVSIAGNPPQELQ
eukprot:EG_transcript_19743